MRGFLVLVRTVRGFLVGTAANRSKFGKNSCNRVLEVICLALGS